MKGAGNDEKQFPLLCSAKRPNATTAPGGISRAAEPPAKAPLGKRVPPG